jgi:hypothetical protein
MKRKAIDTAQRGAEVLLPRRRTTRSDARLEQRAVEEAARTHAHQQRAISQTPLEQALSLVIAGGFLYRYDCLAIATVSKSCNDIWQEEKETFPEWANVEVISFEDNRGKAESNSVNFSQELLTSHVFLRQVFDKVNSLRVAGQPTKKKRSQAEAELLQWGEDFRYARVSIFPAGRGLGLKIGFGHARQDYRFTWVQYLNLHDLTIMTGVFYKHGLTGRAQRLYDGEPLWP